MDRSKNIKTGWALIFGGILLTSVLFYIWCRPERNLLVSIAGTSAFLAMLFVCNKERYLGCTLFTILTALMFSDIVYHSYYDTYLTVELMGAAKLLGDVTDVVLLLIKGRYFTVFLGPVMTWTGAVMLRREDVRSREAFEGMSDADAEAGAQETPSVLMDLKHRRICGTIAAAAAAFIVLNPLQIIPIHSFYSTEIITYHLRDILENTTGYGEIHYEAELEPNYAPDHDDPLFGVAEGRNLIVIQAEALQNFVIGAEYNGQVITPVLNELIAGDTLYFDKYFMQIAAGNTSDAEFATNNSIYGTAQSYTYELYKNNAWKGLPWLLMERGYSTVAMHAYDGKYWSRNETYPTQGFQAFIDMDGYRAKGPETAWGINDEDFFEQSVDYLKEQPQPFYSFMVSLSNHTPFELPAELTDFELKPEHEGTLFGNYLKSVHYADKALETLLTELKQAGLYENSVIAIYGDHFGLAHSDQDNAAHMGEFLGRKYRFDDAANVAMLIHIPGMEEGLAKTVSVAGGQTDFLPTMAYLMGFEELDTLYMGRNLLAKDQEGFVFEYRYARRGTFVTNDYCYIAPADEIFEHGTAWTLDSAEQLKLTRDMRKKFQQSYGLVDLAQEFLDTDAIRALYYSGGKADRVETELVEIKKPAVSKPVEPVLPTQGAVSGSAITPGAITDGAITGGAITGGAITPGAITDGAISGGAITDGAIAGEDIPDAGLSEPEETDPVTTEPAITEPDMDGPGPDDAGEGESEPEKQPEELLQNDGSTQEEIVI